MAAVEEEFFQQASAVSTIRSILQGYPLSIGLLRELLQNSDDAGASEQVFIMDKRQHPTEGLLDNRFIEMQGPAFMAYNDAVLNDKDWEALKNIYESSKIEDDSKIGKYGVGFRTVFNITDLPQILSDSRLAVSDPLSLHFVRGTSISLEHLSSNFPNQLLPFSCTKDGVGYPFKGTVIRCPLRISPGIIDQIVQDEDICKLFQKFIKEELDVSSLFLSNIKRIEIREISLAGEHNVLAEMNITRTDPVPSRFDCVTFTVGVECKQNQNWTRKEWLIVQSNFRFEEAVDLLSELPECTSAVARTLHNSKFSPEVKIAIDTNIPSDANAATYGRLFSYLPLPFSTGWPVHVHAAFGLHTSRANLRGDTGSVPGSQDHTTVQWNMLLFHTFIPRTWGCLLDELVSRELVSNIFHLWPKEGTDELQKFLSLSCKGLVKALLESKASVWPVQGPQSYPTSYRTLDTVVVASPDIPQAAVRALTQVGLPLVLPPRHVFEILRQSCEELPILSPDKAHELLLKKLDDIRCASDEDRKALLEYLLSTDNILNVCDLPLIRTANKELVALTKPGSAVHTFLTRSEFPIFGRCDDTSISLDQFPTVVEAKLVQLGPGCLNFQILSVPRIIEYLSDYPRRLGCRVSDNRTDSSVVRWLSKFWEWLHSFGHKNELFSQIRKFPLLPSMKGLRTAESPLFNWNGEHPSYTMAYQALGLDFLTNSDTFSVSAHASLKNYDLIKSTSDIPAVLDALTLSENSAPLSQPVCETILKHLATRLDECVGKERIQRLRNLPIYPVLRCNSDSSSVIKKCIPIPEGDSIRLVGSPIKFVPVIRGLSFVNLEINIAPALGRFLEPSHPASLSSSDLIELAIEHFTSQPEHLKVTILLEILASRTRICQDVINKLSSHNFVLAEDGLYHIPGDIVDPDSDIGPLYVGCPAWLPSQSSSSAKKILQCLRKLGLLRAKLTPDVVSERVGFIASSNSDDKLDIARNLLRLLCSTNIDLSGVRDISEAKWLPTSRGLCSANECRHAAMTPLAFFDKVLACLEPLPITIPTSLQSALHWDRDISIDLLIKQLGSLLDADTNYESIVEVIKEFGLREWSNADFDSLERVVANRRWIPTTQETLADVTSSVFELSPTNSGFYQVRSDLRAKKLFQRMGCSDHPSTRAILDKLRSIPDGTDVVAVSINLLKSLRDEISSDEREELLIPDQNGHLRPCPEIFYNDIGENSRLVQSEQDFLVHPDLDECLATKLGLNRLGMKYADLRDLGPRMGEAPATTVTRTLRDYTSQQFLLEFLANAEDANATEFKVALNHFTVREDRKLHVMCPAMEMLCKLPSLVIYNNSQFTKEDFDGICRTSIGSKEGRSDTIGEFGLGVLTMFHFTDLAVVISGSQVLFLAPSEKHLPMKRSSVPLELKYVQNYKDQLSVLDGVFGFDKSLHSYDGTLFFLPLRVAENDDNIIRKFWTPEQIATEILKPFEKQAPDCLLFTKFRNIECIDRTTNGIVKSQWSFHADRSQVTAPETEYSIVDTRISSSPSHCSHWNVMTKRLARDQLPLRFQEESSLTRKPSVAGLAVRRDKLSSDSGPSFTFFSRLPLSSPTTLQMHVMASFKLSSDRRQIRLDALEEVQTLYNTWLLQDVIPPLYLDLLAHLLQDRDEYYRHRWPRDKGDNVSNLIVESFYSKHLASCRRPLFTSVYNPMRMLTPQEAVLRDGDYPSLSHLKPDQITELPSRPTELARGKIRIVDTDFIRDQIQSNPEAITGSKDFRLLFDVIWYLTHSNHPEDHPEMIIGLPILPLQDDSFAAFNKKGKGPSYYTWRHHLMKHNFDDSRFVHPNMPRTTDLESLKLNVLPLDALAIKKLVETKLSTFSQEIPTEQQMRWTDSFWASWDAYKSLGLEDAHISHFKLVPTQRSAFVSLDQCKNQEVLLFDGTHGFGACLRALNLSVVDIDKQPVALRDILKDRETFRLSKLGDVLSAMENANTSIRELIGSLDDDLMNMFACWVKRNIADVSDLQIPLALALPIWWSAGGGVPNTLRPASELQLLPTNLTLEDVANIMPFMADCVSDDSSLTHLKVSRMEPDKLRDRLRFPDTLEKELLSQYKTFYEKWTSKVAPHVPLLVPTGTHTLRKPEDLFKREFPYDGVLDESYFLHEEFKGLSIQGMRGRDDLDIPTFKKCAEKLVADSSTLIPDAEKVYRAFNEILSNCSEKKSVWKELDNIPFVPRNRAMVRKLSEQDETKPGLEIPQKVAGLASVVPPAKVVKQEYEAVAWSERACFETQPSEEICEVYQNLGVPDLCEVVAHLCFLSELQVPDVSQRQILLHDVNRVYEYLQEHLQRLKAEKLTEILCQKPLFLNIDNDKEDEKLNWVHGNSLAFECGQREGRVQGIRSFLHPFEKLIKSAGALNVYYPKYMPPEHKGDSDSAVGAFQKIRSNFDQLRSEKNLTDVAFYVEEDSNNPEPMFAHRSLLAAFSEKFKDQFSEDSRESRNASPGSPFPVKLSYSLACVRSFLDFIYTGNKGGNLSVELLLELLVISKEYKTLDLFEEVQGEIIQRRLLMPETVDKIRAVAEKQCAEELEKACNDYKSNNIEFIKKSRGIDVY